MTQGKNHNKIQKSKSKINPKAQIPFGIWVLKIRIYFEVGILNLGFILINTITF